MDGGRVANELVSPHRGEGCDRIAERQETGIGKTARDSDHVLLGDPDIDETIGICIRKWLQRHEPQVTRQQDDAGVLGRDLHQSPNKSGPHCRLLMSLSATS